jgi:hypothetical protein
VDRQSTPVITVRAPHLAGADSKKNRTYVPSGRSYAALCSIGPAAAHHTGHTGRDDPFRPLGSPGGVSLRLFSMQID